MIFFEILRKINKRVKTYKKYKAGLYLSPVRRIERVKPLLNQKMCVMTYDDGPNALEPKPLPKGYSERKTLKVGLTSWLIEQNNNFLAKGTFDCIGSTAENYPDKTGKEGTASWGGIKHDHYPDYGMDNLGGLINQIELGQDLLDNDFEIANHSGRHIIFGKMNLIYNNRTYLRDLDAVLEDLCYNHNHAYKQLGYTMKLSRPPHYIDSISGGFNSYDAYASMGYQYLAASFDGGGWKPSSGDYDKDVENMVEPIKKALEKSVDALDGQIIFQKDGYNMSRNTPVADALGKQLEILYANGYKVVTASELIKNSPFEDFAQGEEYFEYARTLINSGYIAAYKNNSFKADRKITFGELLTMLTPADLYVNVTKLYSDNLRDDFDYNKYDVLAISKIDIGMKKHRYKLNFQYAKYMGYIDFEGSDALLRNNNAEVGKLTMLEVLSKVSFTDGSLNKIKLYIEDKKNSTFKRGESAMLICIALGLTD